MVITECMGIVVNQCVTYHGICVIQIISATQLAIFIRDGIEERRASAIGKSIILKLFCTLLRNFQLKLMCNTTAKQVSAV